MYEKIGFSFLWKSLFQYLTIDNQKYYCKYLNEINCENITDCDIADSSQDQYL